MGEIVNLIWNITHTLISTFLWKTNNFENNLDQQNISVLGFYLSCNVDDKKDSTVFPSLVIKKVTEKAEQRIS